MPTLSIDFADLLYRVTPLTLELAAALRHARLLASMRMMPVMLAVMPQHLRESKTAILQKKAFSHLGAHAYAFYRNFTSLRLSASDFKKKKYDKRL